MLPSWSLLEIFAAITGLLAVYLTAKQIIWCWPVALINTILYTIVFYQSSLFADTGLQVFYFFSSIYGWFYWKKNDVKVLSPIKRIATQEYFWGSIFIFFSFLILGFGLKKYTQASMPLLDSFCVAMSLCAQIFMARRRLENWLIWISVDFIYVGLFIFKELYLTAILYALFIIIAIAGYIDWKKTWNSQHQLKT